MLKSELTIEIKTPSAKNHYKLEFPNVGKLIEIERKKDQLALMNRETLGALYAKTINDAIATFDILIPELKKDLNVNSFYDLKLPEMKPILSAYTMKFLPWWNEWMEEMNIFQENDNTDKDG